MLVRLRIFLFVLPLVVIFFSSALRAEAAAAPIAWWKFDDGSGTSASDSGANSITGTFAKAGSGTNPTWSTDVPSAITFSDPYSLSFSGTGGVTFTWPSALDFAAAAPRSFSLWYKPTANGQNSAGQNRLINWSGNAFDVSGDFGSNTVRDIGYYDGDWHDSGYALTIGTWYHITFTYDGTTERMYINDTDQLDTTIVGRAVGTTLVIGNDPTAYDNGVKGNIDDVRVYDYALTSTQVSNLTAGSSNPDAAPDTTAPSSWLTVPSSGAAIGGSSVTLTATSSDNVAVAGVTFWYDSTHKIGSEITATSSPNTYTTTWDASGLSSGTHTLIAVARDTSNNYATSTAVSVTVDSTAPVISAVASSTSSTGATVTWTTDEAASTKVAYSLDSSYASSTTESDTGSRVTSHSASLTGLLSCTQYSFKTVSADAYSNHATSSAYTFTTTGCPGGATPTSATSTTVTVSSVATSTDSDSGRTLTVVTPANFTATSSTVIIQIKGMDSATVLNSISKPSGLSSASSVAFDVTALINNSVTLDSFDSPVTISYTYTDADVSGLDESTLTMYHYHNGSWLSLSSCSVDTALNKITCTAPSFSTFAIFGTPTSSGSSSSSSSGGGAGLPWCSGPSAPGWNTSLPNGGCNKSVPSTSSITEVKVSPEAVCPYFHFTRALRLGERGEDVRALQKFLNCAGFPLAASGSGSPGHETPNFADRTLQSVEVFQKTYASDILTPIRAVHPTGIFANYSQKKAYGLMDSQ